MIPVTVRYFQEKPRIITVTTLSHVLTGIAGNKPVVEIRAGALVMVNYVNFTLSVIDIKIERALFGIDIVSDETRTVPITRRTIHYGLGFRFDDDGPGHVGDVSDPVSPGMGYSPAG